MRIKLLRTIYIFSLVAIVIRLGYWQIVKAEDLTALAEGQHLSVQNIDAPRGLILASDKSVYATNKPRFLLYGLPKIMKDKTQVATILSHELLPMTLQNQSSPSAQLDTFKLTEQLKTKYLTELNKDLFWVPLQRNIDYDTKKQLENLKIDGIGFDQESVRMYPEASAAAHILGFVGNDASGKPTGYFGLEGFYNGELRGSPGILTEEKDAAGSPILIGKFFKKEPKNGHTLILNIDPTVQYVVDQQVKKGVEKYGAKGGYAVVMNPHTGAIIAMSAYPNYDPSHFADFPREYYKNPVVADSYEPGSTFKVLQVAAAINENLIKPDTICDICAAPVQIAGFAIRTWDNKYHPDTNMTDVLVHSDNTGMVFIARKMGIDKVYDYIQKFGFGQPTGIDLQDETSPDIRPKSQWREIDLATASFGQGIATTGIQMVRAVSVIANGGKLMEPQLVKYIQSPEKTIEIKPRVVGTPITSPTAKTVTEMMVAAVDKGESQYYKKQAGVLNFKVAGKTGTAQIPVAGHYDATKTIASFIGFAPADNPKFVMLVRYVEPTASIYGADTAAPTFFAIAKELFTYYGIAPTE